MSIVTIHPENDPSRVEIIRNHPDIAERLWEIGVLFERWTTDSILESDADAESIIAAYRSSIDRLINRYEFRTVDVISVNPDHPERVSLRNKFLSEHTHDEFEVRFFVEGRGLFYLHSQNKVYVVLCEQGDLISVPDLTRHWFDMGEHPTLKVIRLFTTPEGWVARFTGDPIAENFPKFEDFMARYA
jgi:1,2-dihydroxy-3-keto-5-methylthiopentene dioxygenase